MVSGKKNFALPFVCSANLVKFRVLNTKWNKRKREKDAPKCTQMLVNSEGGGKEKWR
jgi:hypothetical protein